MDKCYHILTNKSIVDYEILDNNWSVTNILDNIAKSNRYHALIDTGALITGLSNIEVAEYLLKNGLTNMEGVVFLDEQDRQMVLVRSTMRVMTLQQCGISISKRFTFYDQIHTTGMDIKQAINAIAVVTLGKDMVFRDYAQGAFRMRGIANGQTIQLFIIPEVKKLINESMKDSNLNQNITDIKHNILCNICAWLILNTIRAERVQFNMLTEQNMHNIWRKKAFNELLIKYGTVGADHCEEIIEKSIDTFRQRIDYSIENIVLYLYHFLKN